MISHFFGRLLEPELGSTENTNASVILIVYAPLTIQLNARASVRYSFPLMELSRRPRHSCPHFRKFLDLLLDFLCPLLPRSLHIQYHGYLHLLVIIQLQKTVASKEKEIAQIQQLLSGQLRCLSLHRCLYLLCITLVSCLSHRLAGHCISDKDINICHQYTRRPMSTDHTSDVCKSFCTCIAPNKAPTSNLTTVIEKKPASPKSIPCSPIVSSVGLLASPSKSICKSSNRKIKPASVRCQGESSIILALNEGAYDNICAKEFSSLYSFDPVSNFQHFLP